jgi:16S rRNA (uracil1498-N3)-methyltransferase
MVDVLRLGPGDRVRVFDGRGAEFLAKIVSADPAAAQIRLIEACAPDAATRVLTVAFAPPPGQRADALVEKATELGATRLVPVLCERVQDFQAEAAGKRIGRWQRKAADAARQSGRALVPEVCAPVPLREFAGEAPGELRLVGTLVEARPLWEVLGEAGEAPESVTMLVGPAGGFTHQEADVAVGAGFAPVSLGPTTLRVETAAIVLLAGVVLWLDGGAGGL